ncbi:MAG TPA: ABC transporter ATP-binding protein [Dehalococcoidia bacterium]|jgi:ABC-2 type transport system ATP-binding protein|nr:ABC transporter ATP-binding protein [Dehalococcoidia bacterium]
MSEKFAIETHDLTKRYDGTTVVDRLNLRVRENEVFGLLGPNGAGKTTTILMLLGLTEPAAGTARVYGFNPTREPLKVKRLVGYLPERVGFYENLTARENLRFIADLNGLSYEEANRRIDEVLEMVGLTEAEIMEKVGPSKREKTVGKFSRGMKQRLGIADVLLKRPKLVFLDEPTAGLDPKGINQLLDLIADLPKMGTTVVLCSHQLYQVQRVCHSIGILSRGKMVIEGSIDKLGREALAGGRYQIQVETTAPTPQLVNVIREVKGVLGVEVQENVLLVSTDTDLRAEISKVVVQNDFPLIQMKIQEFSLDDIYMKYFREEQVGS